VGLRSCTDGPAGLPRRALKPMNGAQRFDWIPRWRKQVLEPQDGVVTVETDGGGIIAHVRSRVNTRGQTLELSGVEARRDRWAEARLLDDPSQIESRRESCPPQ